MFSISCTGVIIKCLTCNNLITLDFNNFEAVSSEERGMGPETQYAEEQEIICDKCGNLVRIEAQAWEYPTGSLNLNNCEFDVNGAEIVNKGNLSSEFE